MEVLINEVLFKLILINTDYEYYFIVDKNFITELWLPRIKIPVKPITGFIKENIKEPWVEITEIIKFSINIWGYQRNIFTSLVPALLNPVIIRLPYIREDNIIIEPDTDILIINSYSLITFMRVILVLLKIKEWTAVLFIILIKKARK